MHDSWVWSASVTPNSTYLFTSGDGGFLKQFDIERKEILKDWGKINKGEIYSMAVTVDSRHLVTGDENGWLKKWEIKSRNIVKDFGQIHCGYVYPICITPDGGFMYTAGGDGGSTHFFEKWNLGDGRL